MKGEPVEVRLLDCEDGLSPSPNSGLADDALNQLRYLFESLPAGVAFLRGPDHVFEFVNPAYAVAIGGRDVLGRPVRETIPEIEGQGYLELLERVWRTGEPAVGRESRVRLDRRGDGVLEEAFFDFTYQPVGDVERGIEGILVHVVEVTAAVRARRQLEALTARLRAAEARYRALFEGSGDAILVADEQGCYLDANPSAVELLGYDRDELLTMRVPDVVAAPYGWTYQEYGRFLTAGCWRGELEVRRKDGSTVGVEALARAVQVEDGAPSMSRPCAT